VAVQQTTVIQMGSEKSVVGAVLLAMFFGPLGMLYSTVLGAGVMFFVSLLIVVPTLGIGLILTVPAGMIWAGFAADAHNKKLRGLSTHQAFGAHATVATASATPPAWHEDPHGSGRLRWFDGYQWTDHYADKPGAEAVPKQLEVGDEAATQVMEAGDQQAYCGTCGHAIGAEARFCSACGETQTTTG